MASTIFFDIHHSFVVDVGIMKRVFDMCIFYVSSVVKLCTSEMHLPSDAPMNNSNSVAFQFMHEFESL